MHYSSLMFDASNKINLEFNDAPNNAGVRVNAELSIDCTDMTNSSSYILVFNRRSNRCLIR